MSKTLDRQLKRLGLSEESTPQDLEVWQTLLKRVRDTYKQYDEDRYLLERSLDLSSKEMQEEAEENKKMGLQLVQMGKIVALGTLASGIAHELNNPLAGVVGYAERLQRSKNLTEKEEKAVTKILELCDRMAATIKHLLKLSRKSDSSDVESIDIRTPLNDCFELVDKQFKVENINVNFNYDAQTYNVSAQKSALVSIFQNLFGNSHDAFLDKNTENRKINVSIYNAPEEKLVVIEYSDNAGGMPNEVLNQIFDPFFTTKDVGAGTGLGLALTKQIIDDLGGHIQVSSEETVGTTFKISLPMSENQNKSTTASLANASGSANFARIVTNTYSALIVDDEEVIVEHLEETLGQTFNLTCTTSSVEAKTHLENKKFDFVVFDLNMPNLTGKDLAKYIRSNNIDTKIIFISGHIDGNSDGSLDEVWPFLLIEKPFPRMHELKQLIIDYIENTSNQQMKKVG